MPQTEINTLFANAGVPVTTDIGITTPGFPTIRIWEISGSTHTLIVGAPTGTGLPTDGLMLAVDQGGSPVVHDGFYTFLFDVANGYDQTMKYLIRVDGGPSLPNIDRYQTAEITPSILDEQLAPDHQITGSTGLILSQTKADTTQLFLDVNVVNDLVTLLLKYDTNRTRIDSIANTLTIFDDDCTTVLRVFELLDQSGTPSTADVCERRPIAGGTDGLPVCP